MSIGTTAIELRVFKKKKKNMDKMGKTFLGIIFTFGALLLVYCLVFTYSTGQKNVKVPYRNSTVPQEYHERTMTEPRANHVHVSAVRYGAVRYGAVRCGTVRSGCAKP